MAFQSARTTDPCWRIWNSAFFFFTLIPVSGSQVTDGYVSQPLKGRQQNHRSAREDDFRTFLLMDERFFIHFTATKCSVRVKLCICL